MMIRKMDSSAEPDGIYALLRRAVAVGVHLVDAADVFSWGVTREFAALRAACCAHIAAVGAGGPEHRPAPVRVQPFRWVAARGAGAAIVEPAR